MSSVHVAVPKWARRYASTCARWATCLLLLACGGSVPPDPDGTIERAKPLATDSWVDGAIECDDGEPDCDDWYLVDIAHSGMLTIEVVVEEAEEPGPIRLSIMDAGGLTIMETDSGGRRESGLRWQAVRGSFYVWLRPANDEEAEYTYRIRASMNRDSSTKGSASPKSRRACVEFDAAQDVNYYDGQAHVIVLSLYPLSSKGGFESAQLSDLAAGAEIPGMEGEHQIVQLAPGERMRFDEVIPVEASQLGIAADFYRPRDGRAQKIVIDASCADQAPRVHLTRSGLLLD